MKASKTKLINSNVIADYVTKSLEDDKAEDVVIIDLIGKTSIADTMIIASGSSARMVNAMAEHIIINLKQLITNVKTEGRDQSDWVLIDAGDVIIHLFRPEVRSFYSIEKIWAVMPGPDLTEETLLNL
jgi:ribosome-associated protein